MSIYFDHNATTQIDERVLQAMLPHLRGGYANAASLHQPGRAARAAIDTAREQVAALVSAQAAQVIFTGGGTEADNLALKGLAARLPRGRILVSAVEHPAVLESAAVLSRQGWEVATLAVDPQGRVCTDALAAQLAAGDVRLVAVMAANNETGVLQPLEEIAPAVRAAGALLHVDAVQMAGKLALDYAATGAHSLALSAHKIYGPKGVGALVLDKSVDIEALLHGGGHEGGLRSGTENTAAIAAFGAAAALAQAELEPRRRHSLALRERLSAVLAAAPGVTVFGTGAERLPNTVQFALAGFEGESLLMALDRNGVAVSSGSACEAGSGEPSHVLVAMGVAADMARGAVRVSMGKDNTIAEVDRFGAILRELAGQQTLPGLNPAVLAG